MKTLARLHFGAELAYLHPVPSKGKDNPDTETSWMKNNILKLYVKAQIMRDTLKNEEGQDLIEYALVVALIAFAAITGMNTVATGINGAFSNIANKLNTSIT